MGEHHLLRHRSVPGIHELKTYLADGGFEAFKKAVTRMKPEEVLAEVKNSGLRGRGGAGFPTGLKWGYIPNDIWPHYVVANADESEPGTFKDREILESNPYQFLEGLMIAAYAVQARSAYIYLRGEFQHIARSLDDRIAELEKIGLLAERLSGSKASLHLFTHLGAGAYICGEETALLESIEGRRGQPRLRPPFPAVSGLFGKPTVINNVETLVNVPLIIGKGVPWFHSFGTAKSPGLKIFSLSGCINRPGNYELPLGTTFRELVYEHGGGIPGGRNIKAIMAAGASSVIIPATDKALDTPMDYESTLQELGPPLASASVIIIDDSINIAWLVDRTSHFFRHESCGKCTPCREGTYWLSRLAEHIVEGSASSGDIDLLETVAREIQNKCLCALGEFAIMPVLSGIQSFRSDFDAMLKKG